MSAHQHHRPSSRNGDIEKDTYREDGGVDHNHEHDTSDDHSDHDASSIGDHDDIEQDLRDLSQPITQPITREKTRASRKSNDLRGPASNVLSAIASRVTTRGWPEPPPPPDGGFKAWVQVACVRISLSKTLDHMRYQTGEYMLILLLGMVSVHSLAVHLGPTLWL